MADEREDKHFYIISQKHEDQALEVIDSNTDAGSLVLARDHKEGADNQLWYKDPLTGTIRTKLNDFSLESKGSDSLAINSFTRGDPNQQWVCQDEYLVNGKDENRVLVLAHGQKKGTGEIYSREKDDTAKQQKWTFKHQPARYFFLVSQMNGLALAREGHRVVMKKNEGDDRFDRLWYEDKDANIRSKHGNLALDGSGNKMVLEKYTGGENQFWVRRNRRVANKNDPEQVLDICQCNEKEGAELIHYAYNGGSNQHWKFEYLD